jgi:AN1-like Zinc finger
VTVAIRFPSNLNFFYIYQGLYVISISKDCTLILIFFLKVFCLEHRTYKEHSCPKSEHNSRTVLVCERCSMSIEKKFGEDEKAVMMRHEKSGSCNPAKKQKPRCPVKRCKEVLTFSNCNTCRKCGLKVCLKHRFPSDHQCKGTTAGAKLPVRLPVRNSLDCREKGVLQSQPPSVKAY